MVYTIFKRTGEPPVLIDSAKLNHYCDSNIIILTMDTLMLLPATLDTVKPKQGAIKYLINTGPAYVLDTINLP
jgi:hypothetical protein